MQVLIVAMLVLGCTVYAAWTLMPSGMRKSLAGTLLGWPLPMPGALTARLQQAAKASSGCGCDGCDHAPKVGKAGSSATGSSAGSSSRSSSGPPSASTTGSVPASTLPSTPQPIRFHPRIRH